MRVKLIITTLIILLISCWVTGCSGNSFNESNIREFYVNFLKAGGGECGFRGNGPKYAFLYDNIWEIRNLKIVKEANESPDKHYVEFTFDRYYRINASDFESNYPLASLDKKIGSKRAGRMSRQMKTKNFKAGECMHRTVRRAMLFHKTNDGWVVKQLSCPNLVSFSDN